MFVAALIIREKKKKKNGSTKYPIIEEWSIKLEHKISRILNCHQDGMLDVGKFS